MSHPLQIAGFLDPKVYRVLEIEKIKRFQEAEAALLEIHERLDDFKFQSPPEPTDNPKLAEARLRYAHACCSAAWRIAHRYLAPTPLTIDEKAALQSPATAAPQPGTAPLVDEK